MAKFFSSLTEFCIEELTRYVVPDESGRMEGKGSKGINGADDSAIVKDKQKDKDRGVNDLDDQHLDGMIQLSISQSSDKEYELQPKKKGRSRSKPQFTTHKPKAPTSSYLLFLHQKKAQFAAKFNLSSISQIAKLASEQWKKLSPVDKQKYSQQSQKQKSRYHQAMKQYRLDYSQQIKQYKRKKQVFYKKNWQLNKERKQKDKLYIEKKKILQSLSKSKLAKKVRTPDNHKDKDKYKHKDEDEDEEQLSSSNEYIQKVKSRNGRDLKERKESKEKKAVVESKVMEDNDQDMIEFDNDLLVI